MITVIIGAWKGRHRRIVPGQAMMGSMAPAVTPADVRAAAATIRAAVVRTPFAPSRTLSAITGAEVGLKFENLQYTGSFKERGARTFLAALSATARERGVVAASAGNHAQGVAYHAHELGIRATIVMPADAPFTKVTNTAHHGAEIILHGEGYAAARREAERLAADTGATLVPAFDDPLIIAGQGTVGLEIFEDAPDLDVIVVPVGGGGLVSGIAVAVKSERRDIRVIGVQVDTYAGMLHALGRTPAPERGVTIAEGIAVAEPGTLTRAIVAELVDDLVVVPEQRIEEAIALALEIEKTVLEGAGAAGLAAVLEHQDRFRGQRVGVVLSGGNIDARVLTSVLLRALARSGRLVRLRVEVPDRPGVLATVAQCVAAARGNIVDVTHRRDQPGVAVKRALLELSIETRDRAHADDIVRHIEAEGLHVEVE
jgi:threonine dehydratase